MIQEIIEQKISSALSPTHLEVLNESHNHSVPPNSETHFKVTVVSSEFEGKMLVRRHQTVNKLLADEFEAGVHALALHTYTPDEWKEKNKSPDSPNCRGGMGK